MEQKTGTYEKEMNNTLTLTEAEGTIQPPEGQEAQTARLVETVTGNEVYISIDENGIPFVCIDGRAGGHLVGPNSAGGSETLFVADDLTTKRFASEDGSTGTGYKNMLNVLKNAGYKIGGHDDSHNQGNTEKSGCGANDRLPQIYDMIVRKSDAIRATAAKLGVEVDDATHELIVKNAAARAAFTPGADLLAELKEEGGDESVDKLVGDHNEAIVVINTRRGTTLSREKLAEGFGDQTQAFNVDVWAFENAAKVISADDDEARQKQIAMVYYNVATALVLCGPKMQVAVR